jgi:hypothetical protein
MARGACTFKQQDVTRALKGAKAAGLDVARVKINPDGSIVIDADTVKAIEPSNAFDNWKASYADKA